MLLVLIIQATVILTVTAQKNLTPDGTATQSSAFDQIDQSKGKPENAVNPPISNEYSLENCSSTKLTTDSGILKAWWMFEFSVGSAYITDITIYYRENNADRMDGFKLYVTNNTSTNPPDGYLCYEDPDTGQPSITQTISCNQLGKYVLYYDDKGSDGGKVIYDPIVELCYVAINGCQKSFWGSDCEISCPESCIEQHCYPGNGSCVFGGCSKINCLKSNCDHDTEVCTDGCKDNRTGLYCTEYNIASNSLIAILPNGNESPSLVSDGNIKSCVTTQGSKIMVQVDIQEMSIVTAIHLTLNVSSVIGGNHTIYVSNTSSLLGKKTVVYSSETLPTAINETNVFRYLTYEARFQETNISIEICEIGIVGCSPAFYGPLCEKMCPINCRGPCDLVTGNCLFGCSNGWSGVDCAKDVECITIVDSMTCKPLPVQVYPSAGPVNGGTLITVTGKFLGNDSDSISVEISGVICHNVTVIVPGTNLTCVIGRGSITQTKGIFVSVNSNNFSDPNTPYFSFKKPNIIDVRPSKGIVSGGTTVIISGQDIDFKGNYRYNISFCDNEICIECRETQIISNQAFRNSVLPNAFHGTVIKCQTGQSEEPRNMTRLQVVIDDFTNLTLNETFQYLPDPTFNISNEPQKSVQSGGSTFTIRGEGFNNVGNITVEKVDKPCEVPDDSLAVCKTPPHLNNETNNQTIIVHFDGLTVHIPIEYVTDPTFVRFGVLEYDKESSITIKP